MKHADVRRDAIHFNLQVVHAASVQKRGFFQDAINATITPIMQQVQGGIQQAQNASQQVGSLIGSVIDGVTGGLQATATRILTQVSSYPRCANQQTANVTSIVNQTGILLYKFY